MPHQNLGGGEKLSGEPQDGEGGCWEVACQQLFKPLPRILSSWGVSPRRRFVVAQAFAAWLVWYVRVTRAPWRSCPPTVEKMLRSIFDPMKFEMSLGHPRVGVP